MAPRAIWRYEVVQNIVRMVGALTAVVVLTIVFAVAMHALGNLSS